MLSVPSTPTLALAKDLKWPKHGAKHVASIFFSFFGATAVNVSNIRLAFEGKSVPDQIPVLFYILTTCQQLVMNFRWFVPVASDRLDGEVHLPL